MKKNLFGSDYIEFCESTAADRVGARIRRVRKARGMLQTELGEKVGLNGDRIQKYENGVRKPKYEMLEKIADALDVEPEAFTDPEITNYIGAMHALFEMEELYDLNIEMVNGRFVLSFGDGRVGGMNENLLDWEKKKRWLETELEKADSDEEKAKILEEYDMWKWNYPAATDHPLKKR